MFFEAIFALIAILILVMVPVGMFAQWMFGQEQ